MPLGAGVSVGVKTGETATGDGIVTVTLIYAVIDTGL